MTFRTAGNLHTPCDDTPSASAPPASAPVPAKPCVFLIFGATGDLTHRKLIPALINLHRNGFLSEACAVVGYARRPLSHEEFRTYLDQRMREDEGDGYDAEAAGFVLDRTYYCAGDFGDPAHFAALKETVDSVAAAHGIGGSRLFYLATSPEFFLTVARRLSEAGLLTETDKAWRRLVVEKPFGRDLDSARELNRELLKLMGERQIYRIDHYLGKETVQNILVLRFGNGIFEPIWNRRYIDHVQITVAEMLGVESRGGYFETAGTLRDMVPNHLFQLVALTAMEPPASFQADAVRNEQAKVIDAIQSMKNDDVQRRAVRGQYGPGSVEGRAAPGYRAELNVAPDSSVETFAALDLRIDNWRWAGVPFFLRTGKRIRQNRSEIAIQFRQPPLLLFRNTPVDEVKPNWLVLHMKPEEGISLSFEAKVPGTLLQIRNVHMDFRYRDTFGASAGTGYERLLYDGMQGDATLFRSAEMTEAAWRVVQPVLDVWGDLPPREFPNYEAGSWGPPEANLLMEQSDRTWRKC